MDLRSLLDQPTGIERASIDAVLGTPETVWQGGEYSHFDGRVAYGGRAVRARRHLLLPALHAAQDATGSVSRGALGYICERLSIPPADAYGVATFYALFDVDGPGGAVVHVCDDLVCMTDAAPVTETLDQIGIRWKHSPCLGRCDRAPAALSHEPGAGYRAATVADGEVRFDQLSTGGVRQDQGDLRLLRRIGLVEPTSLAAYQESGGYECLTRALELGPEGVLAELEKSGLRGRGGAAFPIGAKWRSLAEAAGVEKYVIGNADESEPGTFKDRVLMEGDPFALVEAMTIYGYATGAGRGFVYVRGEYPTAEARLHGAIEAARAEGLLGEDVAGAGFDFDLEVRRGAGAYVCGEETALFASIEGHRGEPRQKPPFPTEAGVFGRPTGINNVETLLTALEVIASGGSAFAAIGTKNSTGPKLFCLTGAITRPGVYEVPLGITLGTLIELAGGLSAGHGLGAVLLGGAAGSFLGPDALAMPLTFEDTAAVGASLGSGAVMVFDDATDFAPVLARIARFFKDESCGQCVPCRIGTVRQEESLVRLAAGRPLGSVAEEMARLDDLARVMTDASICGLGQTAASAVQSAIRLGLAGAPSS